MRPAKPSDADTPEKRLAASFKDARSLLDDVGNEED
jgi:hypothetical protein